MLSANRDAAADQHGDDGGQNAYCQILHFHAPLLVGRLGTHQEAVLKRFISAASAAEVRVLPRILTSPIVPVQPAPAVWNVGKCCQCGNDARHTSTSKQLAQESPGRNYDGGVALKAVHVDIFGIKDDLKRMLGLQTTLEESQSVRKRRSPLLHLD